MCNYNVVLSSMGAIILFYTLFAVLNDFLQYKTPSRVINF